MTEQRKRNEIASVRLSPDELMSLQKLAGGRPISTVLREAALAAARADADTPVRTWRGEAWVLLAQAARVIAIKRAPGYRSDGVGIWNPADARKLAAALLEAADVQEQRNLTDEAWDAAHEVAS